MAPDRPPDPVARKKTLSMPSLTLWISELLQNSHKNGRESYYGGIVLCHNQLQDYRETIKRRGVLDSTFGNPTRSYAGFQTAPNQAAADWAGSMK